MTAIAYVGSSANQESQPRALNIPAVTKPAATQPGDLIVVFLAVNGSSGGINTPDGTWTQRGRLVVSSGYFWCFTKVAGASEPSSYQFTATGTPTSFTGYVCLVYRGVSAVGVVGSSTGNSLTVTPATVTAAGPDMIVYGLSLAANDSISTPAGVTKRINPVSGYPEPLGYDEGLDAAGVTATRNFTRSGSSSQWGTFTLDLVANTPPNAPALTSPANNSTIDRNATQRFAWTFSDPDASDSQSAFDLRYSSDGGASWTVVSGTTPNSFVDIAAGTFPAGDYEWQVRTYDSQGAVGPYSSSSFFAAGTAPATPTITAPTSGGTVDTDPVTVTWSAPSQTAYQVRRVADSSGSADTGTVYYDSGQVTSTSTRSLSVPFETNNRFEHVQVRIQASGLWSAWADIRVEVSYDPPPAPDVTVTPDDATASITVAWTNPAPGTGEVATSYVDLYRSDGTTSIRIATDQATNSSYTDRTPASGVDYAYQAVAVAGNGVQTPSGWVT